MEGLRGRRGGPTIPRIGWAWRIRIGRWRRATPGRPAGGAPAASAHALIPPTARIPRAHGAGSTIGHIRRRAIISRRITGIFLRRAVMKETAFVLRNRAIAIPEKTVFAGRDRAIGAPRTREISAGITARRERNEASISRRRGRLAVTSAADTPAADIRAGIRAEVRTGAECGPSSPRFS